MKGADEDPPTEPVRIVRGPASARAPTLDALPESGTLIAQPPTSKKAAASLFIDPTTLVGQPPLSRSGAQKAGAAFSVPDPDTIIAAPPTPRAGTPKPEASSEAPDPATIVAAQPTPRGGTPRPESSGALSASQIAARASAQAPGSAPQPPSRNNAPKPEAPVASANAPDGASQPPARSSSTKSDTPASRAGSQKPEPASGNAPQPTPRAVTPKPETSSVLSAPPTSNAAPPKSRAGSAAPGPFTQVAPPPTPRTPSAPDPSNAAASSRSAPDAQPSFAAPGQFTQVAPPPAPRFPPGASARVAPPSTEAPPPARAAAVVASFPDSNDDRSGTPEPSSRATVGRYVVLDKLGSGGMGVVYSAYDPELHRRVAVKLLHSDTNTVVRMEGASRLLREAQAMARLSHPNVVSVYDAGTFHGRVFITMELVEGMSLRHWLRVEPRDWHAVLELFRQAGRGLMAAHTAGLVHRDFKPANVLVSKQGRAQVTDFGLARTTADAEAAEAGRATTPARMALAQEDLLISPLTEAGKVMGTPAYMPPEQHEDGRTDARGDQFSFCASLYEALYGQLPFEGKRATEYFQETLLGRVRPPPKGSRVPPWLFRAVSRGLAPAPENRYPSMEELLTALGKDPAVAWRRRGISVAAGLVLAVAVFVTWWVGEQRRATCDGSAARLAGVWDPRRKAEVREAFDATGRPGANDAFSRVEAVLDGYARDWAGMHHEACEATRVKGHQSDEVLSLRMGCLDRRRSALAAVADVLTQTDAESVSTAQDAAQRLPSVAACADVDTLRRGLPESAEQRQRVADLRARVDRATALVDTGRYTQAREELTAALAQAREVGYRPALAEALELEGRLGLVMDDENLARTALKEAFFTAQATRHDEVAARAAARLVTTLSSEPALEAWSVAEANAAIERAGGTPEQQALLETSLGRNAFLRGQYAEAAEAFGRSAALREKQFGAEHLLTLESLRNQAAALSRTPESERAAKLLLQVFETTERVMGKDHPQTAMAANAVGYHLVSTRRFEEGMLYLRRAIALEEQALGPESVTLSYPLQNLAEALEGQNQYAEARTLRERALALDLKAYGAAHPETASDLVMLSELALREGKPRDAVDFAKRSVSAYEAFQKDHPDVANPLTALGQALLAQGNAQAARAPLEKALALRVAHPGRAESMATTRFALARALTSADPARARTLATQALNAYAAEPTTYVAEASRVRAFLQSLGDDASP